MEHYQHVYIEHLDQEQVSCGENYAILNSKIIISFQTVKSSSSWRWRRMCCVPLVVLFELGFLGLVTLCSLLICLYGDVKDYDEDTR